MTSSWPYPAPQPVTSATRPPWAVSPPSGARYDRLAHTALHRWWRPIVGTAAIIAVFLAVSFGFGVVALVFSAVTGVPTASSTARGNAFFRDPLLDLGFQLAILAVAIPIVYGVAWAVQRRPPGTLSSVAGRLRWGWLARCLPVALAAVLLGEGAQDIAVVLTGGETGYRWGGWGAFLPAMVVVVLLVPFQAAAEEYAFRGWILQAFGAYIRNPIPGMVIGSVAFAALHGYTDWGIAYVFGFGILMGWLAIRTGGLEAPIALHVTNNVVAFGFTAASGDLGSALEQGSLPWQSVVGTVVQFAVYATAIPIIARKAAIQTLSH
ncbi:CPBP family intramembrane metalloprotease [Streptosporangiaceae bacterium NEAU-GS5]|nr:CPBP family intramembrane metalloprotease [Streptosporangiaceae bacterium NEAU-GS5]